MPHQSPSPTALRTAYLRAAHQVLDGEPRILEDPFALLLLGPGALQWIKARAESYQSPENRALRAHLVLRSRFAEDRLAAAVPRGVSQYVILGAGFDTFALRQPAWAEKLRILEIDHSGTQEAKRSRLSAAGLVLPPNANFATIDFEREPLGGALLAHRFSAADPTFFSCLGVLMYLKEETVDALLRSVAAFPSGSEIVLTSAAPGQSPSIFDRRAGDLGEPWLSYFEPDALEAKLHACGFSKVEVLSPAEAEERYFRRRPKDLPVPNRRNILSAII